MMTLLFLGAGKVGFQQLREKAQTVGFIMLSVSVA